MKVLQIEDKLQYRLGLSNVDIVETFEEAKEKMENNNYDVFILDGNFPLNKGDEPDINVKAAAEFMKKCNPATKIIVWTNSIRAQKYAEDNNILCFSKKEKTEEHIKKMKKYGLRRYGEIKNKKEIMGIIK